MRKYTLFILIFCFASVSFARAETILLRTGARVKGEILFQNNEVIVIKSESGARFQYPKSDVQEILTTDETEQETQKTEEDDSQITTQKKASILIELSGGGAFIPNETTGGDFAADLLVGSHHIKNRHIFIGGGLGYHGMFLGGQTYNFLPIQAAIRVPLLERKHSPVLGLGLGYGIALSKNYVGGLYAGLDLGYRYQINEKTALALSLFSQFQQAKIEVNQTIIVPKTNEEVNFTNSVGRNLVTFGLKFSLYF